MCFLKKGRFYWGRNGWTSKVGAAIYYDRKKAEQIANVSKGVKAISAKRSLARAGA